MTVDAVGIACKAANATESRNSSTKPSYEINRDGLLPQLIATAQVITNIRSLMPYFSEHAQAFSDCLLADVQHFMALLELACASSCLSLS